MKASPRLAEEYWKIAENRMKNHMIQNVGMNKKEELRQIEENLPVKI
jgi:hypothetical protein